MYRHIVFFSDYVTVTQTRSKNKHTIFETAAVWGDLGILEPENIFKLRQKLRLHFKVSPSQLPSFNALKRLVQRFITSKGQV